MKCWSKWKRKPVIPNSDIMVQWLSKSFNAHMAEIQGEIDRILKHPERLEKIRNNPDYFGEPQVIHNLFLRIKRDPKSAEHCQEVIKAEEMTHAFLCGDLDAPSVDELRAFWDSYLEAYISEQEV